MIMEKPIRIAIINPREADGLARTVVDGCISLSRLGTIDFCLSQPFDYSLDVADKVFGENDFKDYAIGADIIFYINAKRSADDSTANRLAMWHKTVYVDGGEVGKNRRYDFTVQKEILFGENIGFGAPNPEMVAKCKLYFRREKPYSFDIIPLPFGIETRYVSSFDINKKKDIDFVCIFGQDEYPLMRRFARERLEAFCAKNDFSCYTKKTSTPQEFYSLLARSKVGISVGGGGYDTMRFWEILGNNCLLLTERLDIYEPDSKRLDYKRIWQFNNLFDFDYYLEKIGKILKENYKEDELKEEYVKIMQEHSSEARVMEIINICREKGVIKS
jgi:hypothetical protein